MNIEALFRTLIKISSAGAGAGYYEDSQEVLEALIKAVPDSSAPWIALVNTKLLEQDLEGAQMIIDAYRKNSFDDDEASSIDVMEVFLCNLQGNSVSAIDRIANMKMPDNPAFQATISQLSKQLL